MNLVRAEAQRLLARRFTQVLLILLLAAFGVTFATIVGSTHQPTTAEMVAAERQAAELQANQEQWYQRCLEADAATGNSSRALQRCGPPPGQIKPAIFLRDVFIFTEEIRPLLYFLTAFLALFGFLVGASYVGAELTSGGMTNLLLWRPGRDVVLATKLGVLLGGVLTTALVGAGVYLGAFWALGTMAGLPGEVNGEFWADTVLFMGRGILLALLFTALGFAVATLGRHTAAALGVLAGYAVLWEVGARIVLSVLDERRSEAWMFSTYVVAWMEKRYSFYAGCFGAGDDCRQTITFWHAGVVFAALLAIVVGGAFLNFRRRDLA